MKKNPQNPRTYRVITFDVEAFLVKEDNKEEAAQWASGNLISVIDKMGEKSIVVSFMTTNGLRFAGPGKYIVREPDGRLTVREATLFERAFAPVG